MDARGVHGSGKQTKSVSHSVTFDRRIIAIQSSRERSGRQENSPLSSPPLTQGFLANRASIVVVQPSESFLSVRL